MTWPFENDTGAIVKRLAKRSLAGEKRRNLMVVIAVALANTTCWGRNTRSRGTTPPMCTATAT